MEVLKPYRARIDNIDDQILQLLRRRYDVIEDVAKIKARDDIPAILHDRIEEVRERAGAMAEEKGLDADFIRKLYSQLIDHSCQTEDARIKALKAHKGIRPL